MNRFFSFPAQEWSDCCILTPHGIQEIYTVFLRYGASRQQIPLFRIRRIKPFRQGIFNVLLYVHSNLLVTAGQFLIIRDHSHIPVFHPEQQNIILIRIQRNHHFRQGPVSEDPADGQRNDQHAQQERLQEAANLLFLQHSLQGKVDFFLILFFRFLFAKQILLQIPVDPGTYRTFLHMIFHRFPALITANAVDHQRHQIPDDLTIFIHSSFPPSFAPQACASPGSTSPVPSPLIFRTVRRSPGIPVH